MDLLTTDKAIEELSKIMDEKVDFYKVDKNILTINFVKKLSNTQRTQLIAIKSLLANFDCYQNDTSIKDCPFRINKYLDCHKQKNCIMLKIEELLNGTN